MRPEIVEGLGERRSSGGVVGSVEQDVVTVDRQQFEATRPHGRGIPAAPGIVRRGGDASGLERIEDRIGDRDVRGLVPPRSPTRTTPSRGSSTLRPVSIPAAEGRGRTSVSGTPTRRARRRMIVNASSSAPVPQGRRAR